ncbi:hypothetical protein FN846DRAFT_936802 [Sphaerosporella brunnea]|uniref:Uncharacterized protein n=1 Tax=Sphaerosporella brunnea TaxID=1250544 RepID=A0A5J5F438_9PEZI|nr:hypothetical protein FN846DRAFT_936802 [Sphaerosporella brunnea]
MCGRDTGYTGTSLSIVCLCGFLLLELMMCGWIPYRASIGMSLLRSMSSSSLLLRLEASPSGELEEGTAQLLRQVADIGDWLSRGSDGLGTQFRKILGSTRISFERLFGVGLRLPERILTGRLLSCVFGLFVLCCKGF